MTGIWRRLRRDVDGAVAPTVALSLVALIAVGGIAFDYARFATMDSELQNAADQAALAAASQLDGQPGACARAAQAARSLVSNRSLLANDGAETAVIVATEDACDADGTVRFYQDRDKAIAADDDSNAHFVEIEVDPREAVYALTPIVGLFRRAGAAIAFAGLGQAICKVPPVMMCNPNEQDNDPLTDDEFDLDALKGHGIRLIANNGGPTMGPGNFGFLANGASGASILKQWLGYAQPPGECLEYNGVETEPGALESAISALNSRFDVYSNGQLNGIGCAPGGACPPSANSVKDLVMDVSGGGGGKGKGGGPPLACNDASGGGNGWKEALAGLYRPTSASTPYSGTPSAMGHPRDRCHAVSYNGTCSYDGVSPSPIGDGVWDIDAYWRTNHGGANYPTSLNAPIAAASGIPIPAGRTYPTRYQVYMWEMGTAASNNLPPSPRTLTGTNAGLKSYGGAICQTPGLRPSESQPDRRLLTVAVVNCRSHDNGSGISGREEGVLVKAWIDVFLVEPSYPRAGGNLTKYGDVYVEVVGDAGAGGVAQEVQLIKKSVPYLIE